MFYPRPLRLLCLYSLLLQTLIFNVAFAATKPTLVGEMTQGGIVRGHLPFLTEIQLDGQVIEQNDDGYFVFGFGRDAEEKSTLSWREEGQVQSLHLSVKQREYSIQRVDGVPHKTVTPSPDKLKRIRDEAAMVRDARARRFELNYFLQDFIQPLDGPVTGVYGSQRVYNGVPKRPHFGIDYGAPHGTPVVAPADALVTLVHQDMFYSGGTLIMDHGYALSSTFIHLSEVLVEEGQRVKKGEVVGKVGAGGRATGPHLDWRMNWKSVRLDPALILGQSLGEHVKDKE